MTPIPTLRADLATLKDRRDVSGPLALFLASVLDRIEAMEQRGMQIGARPFHADTPWLGKPGEVGAGLDLRAKHTACSVCYGLNPHGCPACSDNKTNEGAKA